ncbi:MAG: hypothetical protein AMXMBFR66_23830 [Pseudomonadota bacterium]
MLPAMDGCSSRRAADRAQPAAVGGRAALAIALAAAAAGVPRAGAQAAEVPASIVVTATRHPILDVDAPAALSVVTRRDIENRGADNVLEAIRGEAGISLQGRAIGGRKVLSLRGMDSKHTLFLVDGRRVGASDRVIGHSDFQYDWVAVEDIERIEIVRGPLSVLYGSEAMGGVVNVITRQPGDRWRWGASAEGSQTEGGRGGDGQRASLRLDGPLGTGLALRAGLAQTRRAALASAADARISELEGRDKTDGWATLQWRPAAAHQIDADLRQTHERRWADAQERSGRRRYHSTVNRIERRLGSLAWEADWGSLGAASALTSQLRAYRVDIDVENERSNGVAVNPPQRIDERVVEGQARVRLGAQDLVSGFEARNEALRDPGLPGGRSLAQHRALFVQDEFAVARALRLTLGLRCDGHNLYGRETSPRAYLVWHGDGPWTFKGGYSHGFMAPNLKQIVPGARVEGPNIVYGNPDLRPETSDGVEFGVGWQRGARQLQAMVFAQRVSHLIDLRLLSAGAVPGTGTYVYENIVRARMSGLEASLVEPLAAGLALGLNYNYLDATGGDGQRLVQRPRHGATLRLDWQQGSWRAGLRAEYSADERLAAAVAGAPSVAAPSITLLGAHLGRTLPGGLELAAGVDNLTNLSLAAKSPLFTAVEPPRTWRLALRGRW